MAWPSLIANDVMPGEPVSASTKGTVGELLFDRDVAVLSKGSTYTFSEVNDGTGGYVIVVSSKVRIPSNMAIGDDIVIAVELWNATAGKTSYVQLEDLGSSSVGVEKTNTNGTTHEWPAPTLAIEAGWMGTLRTIRIQIKTEAGGTAHCSGEGLLANCWFTE